CCGVIATKPSGPVSSPSSWPSSACSSSEGAEDDGRSHTNSRMATRIAPPSSASVLRFIMDSSFARRAQGDGLQPSLELHAHRSAIGGCCRELPRRRALRSAETCRCDTLSPQGGALPRLASGTRSPVCRPWLGRRGIPPVFGRLPGG